MKPALTPISLEITAKALQPPNQSVLFEFSTTLPATDWTALAWFGGFPTGDQVFAGLTTDVGQVVIRATVAEHPPAGMVAVAPRTGVAIKTNPLVPGVRAWRGTTGLKA